MRLVPSNKFKPFSKIIFTDHSKAVLLLWIIFGIYVFLFVMLSCLFIASILSPAGKGLTSWLPCMWCFLMFLSVPHVVSLVRCGTWLYRFLIFAFLLTLKFKFNCLCAFLFFFYIFRLKSNMSDLGWKVSRIPWPFGLYSLPHKLNISSMHMDIGLTVSNNQFFHVLSISMH